MSNRFLRLNGKVILNFGNPFNIYFAKQDGKMNMM